MHGDAKPLPSSAESEQIILGSILLDNELMQSVAETLEPGDFYAPLHRRVYSAMLSLFSAQKPIEPALIVEDMGKDGNVESIGGAVRIANLTFGLPHFSNLTEYITLVKQKSNTRRLIRTCSEIQAMAEDGDHDTVFASAQTKINDLCLEVESGHTDVHFPSLRHVIETEVFSALEDLRYGRSTKMRTGFAGVDHAIGGGVAPSDVLLVAADTGKGKSAFALQLAYNFAASGTPAAFLAGEMTNKENVLRLLSQLSGVTNLNWLSHITDAEYTHLLDWAKAIIDAPIKFEHRISDLASLGPHLRSIVRRHGIKVLVIDYIQLFKLEKADKRKRNERIAEASQEVKRLANELSIGIIEVAQYNREGAKSAQAGLHDLEGSGQLEKDASLIFLLDIADNEFTDDKGWKYHDAKIRVVKGRNVGKSEIDGKFYGRSVRFEFA